jgi:hypothetical protein
VARTPRTLADDDIRTTWTRTELAADLTYVPHADPDNDLRDGGPSRDGTDRTDLRSDGADYGPFGPTHLKVR